MLLGTHDFRVLLPAQARDQPRRADRPPGDAGRWSSTRGPECATSAQGRLLRFEIEANSFCHQMVRSVVGSLVEVGRGRGNAATLLERLRAATRHRAADPAPAQGLCLVSVRLAETGRRRPAGPRLARAAPGPYPGTSAHGTPEA